MTELLELCAARTGHFLYESGHHGDLWLDLDHLFERPRSLVPFVATLASHLSSHAPDMICGPLTGGAVLAQMIGTELGLPACYAHRDAAGATVQYSLPSDAQSALRGRRVALADDAINAGLAVGSTLAALRSCGSAVVAVGTLIVLGGRAAEWCMSESIPFHVLLQVESHLWLPGECPLCASSQPEPIGA